jgi:hypothetical protein
MLALYRALSGVMRSVTDHGKAFGFARLPIALAIELKSRPRDRFIAAIGSENYVWVGKVPLTIYLYKCYIFRTILAVPLAKSKALTVLLKLLQRSKFIIYQLEGFTCALIITSGGKSKKKYSSASDVVGSESQFFLKEAPPWS